MISQRKEVRAVLDTNVVLSALVFSGGATAQLREAWQSGWLLPLASKPTAAELVQVLAYPKFRLSAEDQQQLLADYLPWCEVVEIPSPLPQVPACRDPHDLPFLHLSLAGKADCLVTGDADLFELAPDFSTPIVTVALYLERFGSG